MARNPDSRSSWAHRTEVPLWMSLVGAATGLVLIVVAIWRPQDFLTVAEMRLLICAGLGLVLCGFGTQVSGTWMSWNVVGSGAAAVLLFLVLHYVAPLESRADNAIEGSIEGGFDQPRYFFAESSKGEKILGAWLSPNKQYRIRIEEGHLRDGCIRFISISENAMERTAHVPASFFRGLLNGGKERSENAPADLRLFYSAQTNALFRDQGEDTPVSQNYCVSRVEKSMGAGATRYHRALQSGSSVLSGLLPAAFAAPVDGDVISDLLDRMKSDNLLIGREARLELLERKGASAVSIIMDDLTTHPDDYKTQLNALTFVSTILNADVDMADVRAILSDDDISTLTSFMLHEDPTLKTSAAIAIDSLQDDRASPELIRIAAGNENLDNRNVAAVILSDRFSVASEPQRAEIASGVQAAASQLDATTRSLLEPVLSYDADLSQRVERGWVYVGTKFWEEWDERLFEWNGAEQGLPHVGDVLTAAADMYLRREYVQFDPSIGWVHGPVVGTVESRQKVKVRTVEAVSQAYIWAEIEFVN